MQLPQWLKSQLTTPYLASGVCAHVRVRERGCPLLLLSREETGYFFLSPSLPLPPHGFDCGVSVWQARGRLTRRSGEERAGYEHVTGLVQEVLDIYTLSSRWS